MITIFSTYAGVNPSNGNALFYKDIYETDVSGDPVLDANGDYIVIGKETTESTVLQVITM